MDPDRAPRGMAVWTLDDAATLGTDVVVSHRCSLRVYMAKKCKGCGRRMAIYDICRPCRVEADQRRINRQIQADLLVQVAGNVAERRRLASLEGYDPAVRVTRIS